MQPLRPSFPDGLQVDPSRRCLASPVTVKTPACPLVVAPPPPGRTGEWQLEGEGLDWRALCRDADGTLLGYGLSGEAVQGRLALNRELPSLLD